jgi:ACT domain-containing protein
MKIVITVLGKDRVGIIAAVSGALAANGVNILDISQTILQDYFTMIMLAQMPAEGLAIRELAATLDEVGESLGVQVRVQSEEIFTAMHRV